MVENKKKRALDRIQIEIERIDKKKNTIYFFVVDTKGTPSGSLEYIYRLAKITQDKGYNVVMLYDDDEFVGVDEWLGDEYKSLEHVNIGDEEVNVSPSDILFIPELFTNVMRQTKKLPCKRIAILQNYDFILEQMPYSAQWGDFGIMDAICNTKINQQRLKEIFPYVKSEVISPFIDDLCRADSTPKDLVINIISRDQTNIHRIIKPFYWKYPTYKWVTFRDLRGYPKELYANKLKEGIATIWVDEDTTFGYSAMDAMKAKNVVIAKVPNTIQDWMTNEDGTLNDSCLWFERFDELHTIIASVVRSWVTDKIPSAIEEECEKVVKDYNKEKTENEFVSYLENVLKKRKKDMTSLFKYMETKTEESVGEEDA